MKWLMLQIQRELFSKLVFNPVISNLKLGLCSVLEAG